MKYAFVVSVAICSFTLAAHATKLSDGDHACIALQDDVSHVAARVADPADCCTGRMQCPHYLSTTTLVRPQHDQHT
jgi:hypothetical protein